MAAACSIVIFLLLISQQLVSAHGAATCLARIDCNRAEKEVCVHKEMDVTNGFCAPWASLDSRWCLPPCYMATGTKCETDNLSLFLGLDEQSPYFLLVFGTASTSALQLMIFTPKVHGAKNIGPLKTTVQCAYIGLALTKIWGDGKKVLDAFIHPTLTWWQAFPAIIAIIVTSTNMTATVAVVAQVYCLLDTKDDVADKVEDELGALFLCYACMMLVVYGLVMLVICAYAFFSGLLYCWVAVPLAGLVYCFAQFMAFLAKTTMACTQTQNEELEANLLEDMKDKECCSWTHLSYDFLTLMSLPLVQLLIVTGIRLCDGYGYLQAIYLTLTERHLVSYVGMVCKSVMHKIDAIALFL